MEYIALSSTSLLYPWLKHVTNTTIKLVRGCSTKSTVKRKRDRKIVKKATSSNGTQPVRRECSKKYSTLVKKEALESSSKPLVVILGWNDCKTKHLGKYSVLFEKKDWPTVCLPTKSYNTFLRANTKVKTISYYMIDLIIQLTKNEKKVVFLSFSMGGISVYFHIAEALTTPGHEYFNAFQIAGSIFDSTPTKPDTESVARVKISVTKGIRNPVYRAITSRAFEFLIPLAIRKNYLLERFFDDFGNMPLTSPELFLYSKSDKLSLFEHIEEHIANRKSQGIQVFSKCWEDSDHVAHYMKYPTEYVEEIENFLKVCNLTAG